MASARSETIGTAPRALIAPFAATALALIASVATIVFFAQLAAIVSARVPDGRHLVVAAGWLLLSVVASYTSQRILSRFSYRTLHRARLSLARAVADAPLEQVEAVGIERLLTILTDDIQRIYALIAYVPALVPATFIILGCVGYLFFVQLWVGIGAIALAALFLTMGGRATLAATRVLMKGRADDEAIRRKATHLVLGARAVKLNARRRRKLVEGDIRRASASAVRHYVQCMVMYRGYDEIVRVVYFGVLLVVLAASAAKHGFGAAGTSLAVIILIYLPSQIQIVNFGWELMGPAWASARELRTLYADLVQQRPTEELSRERPFADWQRIALRDVCFTYRPRDGAAPFTIGPLDMMLRRGDLVFVTGRNGAGKTTLSKLLTGLYVPSRGSVQVDGSEVAAADLPAYRELFTILFADKVVFDETHPAEGAEADAAALIEDLGLAGKVTLSGNRFSTTSLSTGQRDRLALIDAILQRRPVLILDEWAANQDPAARADFYDRWLPRIRAAGQTAIVISHDDRYYDRADLLWSIEDGRLTTIGRAP